MRKPRHVYVHSEDLDGWLAPQNRPMLRLYTELLRRFQGLTLETADAVHEVQVVLNSGKYPDYLEAQAHPWGGRFVISGNGAAWRECGGQTHVLVPCGAEFAVLRRLLHLPPAAAGVVRLRIGDRTVEAAIEEGKFTGEGEFVLSLFPEPEPVRHRWSFTGGVDRHTLHAHLCGLIREAGLPLSVLEPHPDGAVDVVPLWNGRPIGKWTLPLLAREIFPGAHLHLAHGGDGANDLCALEEEGVTALTSSACPRCAEVAARRGGIVAARSPEAGAAIECYAELAHRGWYGPLSETVLGLCRAHLR